MEQNNKNFESETAQNIMPGERRESGAVMRSRENRDAEPEKASADFGAGREKERKSEGCRLEPALSLPNDQDQRQHRPNAVLEAARCLFRTNLSNSRFSSSIDFNFLKSIKDSIIFLNIIPRAIIMKLRDTNMIINNVSIDSKSVQASPNDQDQRP